MNDVIAFILTIILCIMVVKLVSSSEAPSRSPPERQQIRQNNINYGQIDVIYNLKNRVNKVENLILDVKTADPETLYRSVSINIPGGSGDYNFLIDGENQVSDRLIQLLESEKEKLLEELRKETGKLYTPPDEDKQQTHYTL